MSKKNPIKKNEDTGKYYFSISAGKKANGKRNQIFRTGFETYKKADEAYTQIKYELKQGSFIDPSSTRFYEVLEKWQKRVKHQIAESTYIRYERMCRQQILPAIGHIKVQEIKQITVQNFIDDLANGTYGKKYAKKTCRTVLSILNGVFKLALKDGLIKQNPNFDIDLPKKSNYIMVIWDEADREKFITYRHDKNRGKYYLAFLVAMQTGMRKGEILGLTWDNVDFENNLIWVNKIFSSDEKKIVHRTKNGNFRQVPMSDLLKEELLKLKEVQKMQNPKNPLNLVFPSRNGNVPNQSYFNDRLDVICEKANLPRITFHQLRHTFATMLLKDGMYINLVQHALGHSKASITLDVYSHVLPSMQQTVANKLNEMNSKPNVIAK